MDEIFAKYLDVLKPLLAEIEAEGMHFPTAVLNEIRCAFDHLARSSADVSAQTRNIERAARHVDRAVYDCYKWLIVLYHDRIEAFVAQNKHKDWSTVDGGRFHRKFCELKSAAKSCYINAKRQADSEENWLKAYQAYRAITCFLDDPKNVLAVTEGKSKETWRMQLLWAIIGAVIGAVLSIVISVFQ